MGMLPAPCLPEVEQPSLDLSIRGLIPSLLSACGPGGFVCPQLFCGYEAFSAWQSGAAWIAPGCNIIYPTHFVKCLRRNKYWFLKAKHKPAVPRLSPSKRCKFLVKSIGLNFGVYWGFERQFYCVLLCEYLSEMQTQIMCEERPLFSPSSLDAVNLLPELPGWILVCSPSLNWGLPFSFPVFSMWFLSCCLPQCCWGCCKGCFKDVGI